MAGQTSGKTSYEARKEARKALVEQRREEKNRRKRKQRMALLALLLLAVVGVGLCWRAGKLDDRLPAVLRRQAETETASEQAPEAEEEAAELSPAGVGGVVFKEQILFKPTAAPSTHPSRYLVSADFQVKDLLHPEEETEAETPAAEGTEGETAEAPKPVFTPWYRASFGKGSDYTLMDGITTFRGNNFRDTASSGSVKLENRMLVKNWTVETGSLKYNDKLWTGSGWTGQPLVVKWPQETKAVMNMYSWAKEKEDLVEVICPCMDGKIYFLDLVTGEATRQVLDIGYTFKGCGSLDPRGYPILYVGSGYTSYNGRSRAFIISLIDGSVLYTFGNADDFSDRSSASFFDSAPLLAAADDTLIWPGENGILYLLHLNTSFNRSTGRLSVNPDRMAKWKYTGTRTEEDRFFPGIESSAAAYGGYLFMADGGGHLICLDLQTLQPVWVQDTLDDTNSSPVLSVENGHLYLYIGTTFHLGWRSSFTASVPVWKIDAETGEILWKTEYECHSEEGVSGGVKSTIACGKNGLSEYLYVTVAMTKDTSRGVLACLKKETGEIVWEQESIYAWSSPVCVYEEDGTGLVLHCDSGGTVFLLDGLTGKDYEDFSLGQCTVEASPAVYGNYAVIGTRDYRIVGLELK